LDFASPPAAAESTITPAPIKPLPRSLSCSIKLIPWLSNQSLIRLRGSPMWSLTHFLISSYLVISDQIAVPRPIIAVTIPNFFQKSGFNNQSQMLFSFFFSLDASSVGFFKIPVKRRTTLSFQVFSSFSFSLSLKAWSFSIIVSCCASFSSFFPWSISSFKESKLIETKSDNFW